MGTIYGTYHDGRVELDAPVDWPDGVRVGIEPIAGRSEDDWPDTIEGREALIARFDSIPPLEVEWPAESAEERDRQIALLDSLEPLRFTPEEEADLASFRAEVREVTLRAVRKQMGLE